MIVLFYLAVFAVAFGIWTSWHIPKATAAALITVALSAQGSAQGSGDRYNCTTAFTRRAPNVALGFAITWGGARATRSLKVGVGLSVAAGLYKAVRDSRDGNDRASVGTNLSIHVAGTMIGAALAKHQLEKPDFAKASPLAQPLENQYLSDSGLAVALR